MVGVHTLRSTQNKRAHKIKRCVCARARVFVCVRPSESPGWISAMIFLVHHDNNKMGPIQLYGFRAQTIPSITPLKCTSASIQALSASTTKEYTNLDHKHIANCQAELAIFQLSMLQGWFFLTYGHFIARQPWASLWCPQGHREVKIYGAQEGKYH